MTETPVTDPAATAARASTVRRAWTAAIVVAVIGLLLGTYQLVQAGTDLLDLHVYRIGGQALLDGSDLYSAREPRTDLPFTYTPFAGVFFVPLAAIPLLLAKVVWTALSLAALIRSAVLILRITRRGPSGPLAGAALLATVGVGIALEPVLATLLFGQINLIVMWMVLEDLVGSPPRKLRGALLGVACGLKLVPGIFVVYLLCVRRFRDAFVAACAGAATVAIGFLLQPGEAWRYWTGVAYDAERMGSPAYAGNQSLKGLTERLAGPEAPGVLWAVLVALVVVVGLVTATVLTRAGQLDLAIAAVALIMLLVSPISWSHHWVWALLLIVIAFQRRHDAAGWLAALAWTTFVFVSWCIWWAPYRNGREFDASGWELITQNAYPITALGWLVALAVIARRTAVAGAQSPATAPVDGQAATSTPGHLPSSGIDRVI